MDVIHKKKQAMARRRAGRRRIQFDNHFASRVISVSLTVSIFLIDLYPFTLNHCHCAARASPVLARVVHVTRRWQPSRLRCFSPPRRPKGFVRRVFVAGRVILPGVWCASPRPPPVARPGQPRCLVCRLPASRPCLYANAAIHESSQSPRTPRMPPRAMPP